MGIVRFALRFPHTFYVVAALVLFLGVVASIKMPTDVFPEINIPVVTVIWSYTGLSTPEMEQRVTTYSQYAISSNVNGIKNIEAQTFAGLSVQKIYFQPDVNLDLAIAQIVSATNAIRALLPPGIQAPLVVQFNASSVPVLQISLSSDTLSEQQLYDYGIYRIRQQLAPIPGITLPTPAGGKYRQIMVDLDPAKLLAKGLTPLDVVNAVNAQNLTLPAGTAKFGHTQYAVRTNATPASIDDLNNIPVKVVNGATIFVKDVGQVHDGWLVQQNVVRKDGRRSVLLSIIKNGNASTLSVVNAVHKALETARAAAPPGMQINGILVDDSTVTIENTHRLLTEEGMPLPQATLHGAAGIAIPTLVSTLAISCVFTSVVFLDGPAKYLFTPLGLAVVFAMLASYGFSRTLTPIVIGLLLKGENHGPSAGPASGLFARFHAAFERGFETMRHGYSRSLAGLIEHRFVIPAFMLLLLAIGVVTFPFVGRDFFPAIDGGQIQLHVRAPAGTRIEATEKIFQQVEDKIREIIPASERDLIVDNIGLPARAYNLAFTDGSTIGVNDGIILVSLKDGHQPTSEYVRKLRAALPAAFPEDTFYFQAADIVTQILNFGLPAQIDVRTVGYDKDNNLRVANELRRRIAAIPGIADAHLQQEVDAPAFYADIDRTRAAQLGLNANTIPTNVNVSLSSSEQVTPNFWTDPKSGIPYYLAVQTPENKISSLSDLRNTPVSTALSTTLTDVPVPGLLSNVATFKRGSVPTNSNQANVQPVYEVYASVQGRDLGSVAHQIGGIVADLQKQLKPGNTIQVIGQIQSMNSAFINLGIGLLFAAVFVYLLMVVNYQNFGDPFVVILALPATLCGILTMLFITGTTLNVPSLMGAIMAVGVASANSILLVTFAREQQLAGKTAFQAAIEAGHTRIRPVLMTAAAMIVGMIPMAIGAPGEEQNAALARAVIGGLLFATPTTLLVVPYLFAMLRKGNDGKGHHGVFDEVLE